jgi:hypothetical protein
MKASRESEIDYCARCGGDHGKVMFHRFKGKPMSSDGFDWHYWGWCPTFLEPIILRVDEDEEPIVCRKCDKEIEEGKDGPVCGCPQGRKDSKPSLNEAR